MSRSQVDNQAFQCFQNVYLSTCQQSEAIGSLLSASKCGREHSNEM